MTFTSSQVTHVRTTKQGAIGEPNVGTYTYDPPAVVVELPNWDPFIKETVLWENTGTVSGDTLNLAILEGDIQYELVFEKQ